MKDTLTVSIILGKELTQDEVKIINEARLNEFGSTNKINPNPNNEDWEKKYFLVKEKQHMVAFGRLHEVEVLFDKKKYHILGIATIIALEKGRGYGILLMSEIKKYLQQLRKTGVGFCEREVSPFYEKCGYNILRKGNVRFQYDTPSPHPDDDVLYLNGEDNLMKKIIENPDLNAIISRPQW